MLIGIERSQAMASQPCWIVEFWIVFWSKKGGKLHWKERRKKKWESNKQK